MSGAAPPVPPLDDRDGVIWLDGAFVPWREARLHVLSHGLHYGGSVFEGERVYDGRVFALSEHSARLVASARHMGYALPWTAAELDAVTREVVAAADLTDGYVRPVAWRGGDTLRLVAPDSRVHLAVAAWPWPRIFTEGPRGIRLRTSRWRRPAPDTAPIRAKAAALYAIGALAGQEAEEAGFDDALLLDHRGRLAEATGANLFLVIDGELHTPPPECVLDGITRRTVIGLAGGLGLPVVERHLAPAELDRATEVFLTGTAYEVQPVTGVDGRSFPLGEVGAALTEAYARAVRAGGADRSGYPAPAGAGSDTG
ncbi:branched-chain amino acid transaminase [Streptomyces spectabilis]|uniref:Branched-chain-amino-acid aminotransferase n=1 Tax=Streptomyces spectabilis TaxID=68270 RepID=A0A5P2XLB4_STRST|nr:branched-chain amino acid transaminase [Streptomyces spectabilis]MBB5106879.1 branched-chain amino acid aminotransferase [Streptomyces spectabilis]MCI3906391.1 branched-chain amino acid transaminase [Streptomyces spectabilis]QEV63242.1 branched-chain amino acid transaminase [Streptomyces spectabilis]GGV40959.1 branched-chain amino acid aminotransferase [Streptomyces spectabilis]